MSSQYVLASQVSPIHTRRAKRVRLVRKYEVPELRGRATSKSKECLFHDKESGDLYVPAMITGIESSGEWVADASSDAPFLLWDRECTELLGMTADCLYSSYEHDNVDVPTELETLIGKAMVFKDESGTDEVDSPNKIVLPRKPEGD
nr:protein FAR1-RELATED SEQUENCE 5-like [Ipomoea batatas]